MSDKTWKAVERRVAAFFGTVRNSLSGGNSKMTRSDSLHPTLYIESKWRQKHSAITLWNDTAAKAKREQKIPVVILAEKSRPGFWVLCHSSDLKKVAGEVAE